METQAEAGVMQHKPGVVVTTETVRGRKDLPLSLCREGRPAHSNLWRLLASTAVQEKVCVVLSPPAVAFVTAAPGNAVAAQWVSAHL